MFILLTLWAQESTSYKTEHSILKKEIFRISKNLKNYFDKCGQYPTTENGIENLTTCKVEKADVQNHVLKNEFGYVIVYKSDGNEYQLINIGDTVIYVAKVIENKEFFDIFQNDEEALKNLGLPSVKNR